ANASATREIARTTQSARVSNDPKIALIEPLSWAIRPSIEPPHRTRKCLGPSRDGGRIADTSLLDVLPAHESTSPSRATRVRIGVPGSLVGGTGALQLSGRVSVSNLVRLGVDRAALPAL